LKPLGSDDAYEVIGVVGDTRWGVSQPVNATCIGLYTEGTSVLQPSSFARRAM